MRFGTFVSALALFVVPAILSGCEKIADVRYDRSLGRDCAEVDGGPPQPYPGMQSGEECLWCKKVDGSICCESCSMVNEEGLVCEKNDACE
jgi:hypothetical protein